MITKEKLDCLIDKMLERNKLFQEVNDVYETCGDGEMHWHIFRYTDFLEIISVLRITPQEHLEYRDNVYMAAYTAEYRGLEIFCLRRYKG